MLLAPAAARARTPLALLPATGANVGAPQLEAATDVLRAHLEATGRFTVVRATSPDAGEPGPAQAAEAAQASGAAVAVTLRVSRLGSTALVRLGVYGPDGALVHADQLSALGPDDLDPVLERLAKGLAEGGFARDLAEIHTVTAHEEQPFRKRPASAAAGIRLGALMPVNRPDPAARTGALSGLGLVSWWDADAFLADVSLDFYTSDVDPLSNPDRLLAVSTGVYLPLSRGNVAPFVGGGLSWAWSKLGGARGGSGLQPRAAAGLLIGRLSDVSVRVEAAYFWSLYPERELGTGREVRVQGAAFALVLQAAPR
jgi:hypothetical protein